MLGVELKHLGGFYEHPGPNDKSKGYGDEQPTIVGRAAGARGRAPCGALGGGTGHRSSIHRGPARRAIEPNPCDFRPPFGLVGQVPQ